MFGIVVLRRNNTMAKKKILDTTPICEKCKKVAPINESASNENWIVYDVRELCECGGRFRARCLVEINDE